MIAQPREVKSEEVREIKCGGGTFDVIFAPPAMMRSICAINSSRRRSILHTTLDVTATEFENLLQPPKQRAPRKSLGRELGEDKLWGGSPFRSRAHFGSTTSGER